jgi:polyphosphate kinase
MPNTLTLTTSRDLSDPSLYINRELSWLEFNHRVLEEAMDPQAPLLERVKFLTIMSSNLDEFFMVRVAGLKRQVRSQGIQRGPDGMTAEEQLRAIAARCHSMVREQYACLREEILPGLAQHGILLKGISELSSDQARWVKDYFHRQVFPVLTPLALDPAHPFPHLRNRSLNLVVTLRRDRSDRSPLYLAVVQVPSVIPRLVHLPAGPGEPGHQFVLLEDVIRAQMSELFQGLLVTGCFAFRITRDSDLSFDEEEAEDLLDTIEQEVRKREWGDAVRLEIDKKCSPQALEELLPALQISEEDVYSIDGPLNLVDFMALYRLPDHADLKDEPFVPPVVRPLQGKKDLFAVIRQNDVLLHHPFESCSSVVVLVEQAADDPEVLAIKLTLYRTSGDSPIVGALARAAQNGKQVTAVVELKARFDEENNIVWARALERAGVHVVYGLVGLKTHCKALLIVRREGSSDRLRRYVHMSTGNYHPSTARLYTDLGLLTASLKIGQDVSRLFNILTGYSEFPNWRRLAVAPVGMRERFIELIEREGAPGADHRPDEQPGRPGGDPGALPGVAVGGEDRADRPRDLLPARGRGGGEREHPGGQHRRPVPGALPGVLLPERRQRRGLPLQRRLDAPEPLAPRRGDVPGRGPGPEAADRRRDPGDAPEGQREGAGAAAGRAVRAGPRPAGTQPGGQPGVLPAEGAGAALFGAGQGAERGPAGPRPLRPAGGGRTRRARAADGAVPRAVGPAGAAAGGAAAAGPGRGGGDAGAAGAGAGGSRLGLFHHRDTETRRKPEEGQRGTTGWGSMDSGARIRRFLVLRQRRRDAERA